MFAKIPIECYLKINFDTCKFHKDLDKVKSIFMNFPIGKSGLFILNDDYRCDPIVLSIWDNDSFIDISGTINPNYKYLVKVEDKQLANYTLIENAEVNFYNTVMHSCHILVPDYFLDEIKGEVNESN